MISLRKKKSEVLSQLPPKLISKLYFEASPAVRRRVTNRLNTFQSLSELERLAIEGDDEIERTPTHKVMKLFRANTLARVGVRSINWAKETFLEDDGVGNSKKLIIFAYHREVMDKLEIGLKKIKAKFVRIDGSTSQKNRDKKIEQFKNNCNCQIGLFSIGSCGTGLNLTVATTILFAEMYWSRNSHAQAEDRIHRIDQNEPCNIFYAMFSESLDEIIYNKLQKTKRLTEAVVDGRGMKRKRNQKRKRSD
jgi:SWI/SNF-related matrix-associated actin-dependent regulator 1 of chromatin subfamily A